MVAHQFCSEQPAAASLCHIMIAMPRCLGYSRNTFKVRHPCPSTCTSSSVACCILPLHTSSRL